MLKTLTSRLLKPCYSTQIKSSFNQHIFCRFLAKKVALEDLSILKEEADVMQIDGYYPTGFKIRGILIEGAVLCFQDIWLQWKAKTIEDVTPESLAFLRLFRPLPDLLILGCGPKILPLPVKVAAMLKELNIRYESIDSRNATGTFNVLNSEGRSVVGALLPLALEDDEDYFDEPDHV